MSNETKTISVELPAEVLKEGSDSAHTSATLQANPEQLKLLTILRQDFEAHQRSQAEDCLKWLDRLIRVSELRISFFEKLILLAGGAIAFSLTFLAFLHREAHPVVAIGKLKGAWVLLLLSVVLGWLHNLFRCAMVDSAFSTSVALGSSVQQSLASMLVTPAAGLFGGMEAPPMTLTDFMTLASKTLQESSKKTRDSGVEQVNWLRRFQSGSAYLGAAALASVIVALWLITRFALRNAGLL